MLPKECLSDIKKKMANSIDQDEPSHLDLHCLQKCLSWSTGLKWLISKEMALHQTNIDFIAGMQLLKKQSGRGVSEAD